MLKDRGNLFRRGGVSWNIHPMRGTVVRRMTISVQRCTFWGQSISPSILIADTRRLCLLTDQSTPGTSRGCCEVRCQHDFGRWLPLVRGVGTSGGQGGDLQILDVETVEIFPSGINSKWWDGG